MKANIALFIYKKKQTLQHVLEPILAYGPERLYIIQDRSNEKIEKELQNALNPLIQDIPHQWIIPSEHQGIGRIFDFGLGAVFEKENCIIVLEDDTVASPLFFDFCNNQLQNLENHLEYGSIIGTPLIQNGRIGHLDSPFGFPYWGWATWKDRWLSQPINDSFFEAWNTENNELNGIINTFAQTKGLNISWDVRWSMWQYHKCLRVRLPQQNLISNIGFQEEGTFTKNPKSAFSQIPISNSDDPNSELSLVQYIHKIWQFLTEYRNN